MEYKPDDEFDEESPNYKRLSNAMDAVDKFELIYSTKHTTIFQVPTKDLKKLLKALMVGTGLSTAWEKISNRRPHEARNDL